MNKLVEIIKESNIDNFWVPGGTDKNSEHSYCDYYEEIFTPYVDKECNILEIGSWQGGFTYVMSKFLPKAKFTTIDIQDKFYEHHRNSIGSDRITNHKLVDAYDFNTLNLVKDCQFDFILEDGTHLLHDNLFVFYNYFKLIKPNGSLVIEDMDEPHLIKLLKHIDQTKYNCRVLDVRHVKQRGDDILIEIKHKNLDY